MARVLGVDLHKNNFVVGYRTKRKGKIVKRYELKKKSLDEFEKSLRKSDTVVLEVTGNSNYFARKIRSKVKEVKVINPLEFKIITKSVKKTDEEDVFKMADYVAKGVPIPEVRLKEKTQSQLSSLLQTRDKIVKRRSTSKNKIHGLLVMNGIVSKKEEFSSKKGMEKYLAHPQLDEGDRFELQLLITEILHANETVKKIDEEVKKRGKQLKGYKNITSIKGIGPITASIILNTIGNIDDFESPKKLASYFGIVPRVHNSNNTIKHGRITKRGNKIARTALVQSTLIAIRYSPFLRAFYDRLKAKKGSGKAIIATANKLLKIIYNTVKNNWVFDDFAQYKLIVV